MQLFMGVCVSWCPDVCTLRQHPRVCVCKVFQCVIMLIPVDSFSVQATFCVTASQFYRHFNLSIGLILHLGITGCPGRVTNENRSGHRVLDHLPVQLLSHFVCTFHLTIQSLIKARIKYSLFLIPSGNWVGILGCKASGSETTCCFSPKIQIPKTKSQ